MNPLVVIFLVGTGIALALVLFERYLDHRDGQPNYAPIALFVFAFLMALVWAGADLYAQIIIPDHCSGLTPWDLEWWLRSCGLLPDGK